jgi:hypothetical protein
MLQFCEGSTQLVTLKHIMNLPTTLLDWVSLLAGLVGIIAAIVGFGIWLYRLGVNNGLKTVRQANLAKRYEILYAPMYSLFLTRHVTSARAILAPYLSQRWGYAKDHLRKGHLSQALVALFDKQPSKEVAEIEFGHSFPMAEILQILKGNEAYADEKLLELIRLADRAKYENQGDYDGMTDEEFDLFGHIVTMNAKLKHIFSPNTVR